MKNDDSAIATEEPALRVRPASGLLWGLLGVLAFSFTIPFTRVADGGLSPLFIGAGRAVVAAVLAAAGLRLSGQPCPSSRQWLRLAWVAGGVVVGFPLLTSYALTSVPAGHGAVIIAVLPAATAVAVVIRSGEHQPWLFWIVAGIGALAAIGFALDQGGGYGSVRWADILLFGAVAAAAVGYAEGGLLARELGAWQTVSWALLLVSPGMLALLGVAVLRDAPSATAAQWAAFGYLAVVSAFLGFFAWYRGLALGPMARVSQVQLVQPVFSICWAGLLLHERLTPATAAGAVVVVGCAFVAVRVRLNQAR
ncbi:MAG: DMT family transporter [Jatrophihabitans sp.]|uniref:DMT family transporter n=1 Tax=Jatrophihabitans sp. TaxID=1932789 RepID=UPI00390CFE46